jgi:hypothetical protein
MDCSSSLVRPGSEGFPKAITLIDDGKKNEKEKTIARKRNA